MANWSVDKVEVVGPLTLRVEHRDGVAGLVKFQSDSLRGVFKVLADPNYFAQVGIAGGAVSWPNEMPDMAPDRMHDELIAGNGEWIVN